MTDVAERDGLGLHVDMLDVDRLREWARLLLVHGADISHWASVPFVAGKMQTLATELEKTVRDVGTLRDQRAALLAAARAVIDRGDSEGWLCYNGTDESRLVELEDAVDAVDPHGPDAVADERTRATATPDPAAVSSTPQPDDK